VIYLVKERFVQRFIDLDTQDDGILCDPIPVFYYPYVNRFINDETGEPIHNISEIIDWWVLDHFKKTEDYMLVYGKDKDLYELIRVADKGRRPF
jgi:hypothetical protein